MFMFLAMVRTVIQPNLLLGVAVLEVVVLVRFVVMTIIVLLLLNVRPRLLLVNMVGTLALVEFLECRKLLKELVQLENTMNLLHQPKTVAVLVQILLLLFLLIWKWLQVRFSKRVIKLRLENVFYQESNAILIPAKLIVVNLPPTVLVSEELLKVNQIFMNYQIVILKAKKSLKFL